MNSDNTTITLRGITDYMFHDLNLGTTADSFYNSQQADFKDITYQLNVQENFEIFKRGRSYAFPEESKDFIVFLLCSYTNEFVPIRQKNPADLDDEFAVKVYEGILNLFRLANTDLSSLQQVATNLNTILNYPVRKQKAVFSSFQKMLTKNLSAPYLINLDPLSQSEWLSSLNADFMRLLCKYDELYSLMLKIRTSEINDQIILSSQNQSREEDLAANIDFEIAEELSLRMNNDPILSSLEEERNSILGIVVDPITQKTTKIAKWKIIKPETEQRFAQLSQAYVERCKTLKRTILEEKYPSLPEEIVNLVMNDTVPDINYSSLMSPHELLLEAQEQLDGQTE